MLIVDNLIPHSHENLSCLRSGVDNPRFIDDDTAEELFTALLRQPNFWHEYVINWKHIILAKLLAKQLPRAPELFVN